MESVTASDVSPVRPGATPQLDTTAAGANLQPRCNLQPVWNRLTAAIVSVLRTHFSNATFIEHPDLVDRVYVAGDASPIVITSLAEWRPNQAQQRPALLVDRLPQEKDVSKRGIGGDQYQGIRPGHYSDLMAGRHVVHCVGGREGEAETLAWEVWRVLKRYAPVFFEKLALMRFMPDHIDKRVKLETEAKDTVYAVPVVVSYGYMEAWRVTPVDEAEITAIRTVMSVV